MKKSVVLVLVSMLIFVCGCNNNKEFVKECVLTTSNVAQGYKLKSEYTINIKGDIVTSVDMVETFTSSDEEVLSSFEETLINTYKTSNQVYGGYKNEIVKKDGELVSTTTIDYSKLNLKKYIEDNSSMRNLVNSNNELLANKLIDVYEGLGAVCN